MTRSTIIPKLRVSTAAGSDPDVIEIEDIDIDDCDQVYADESEVSLFGFPRSCPRNRDGLHCVYPDAVNPTVCVYCGKPAELGE